VLIWLVIGAQMVTTSQLLNYNWDNQGWSYFTTHESAMLFQWMLCYTLLYNPQHVPQQCCFNMSEELRAAGTHYRAKIQCLHESVIEGVALY
jgi:hypothetical protein